MAIYLDEQLDDEPLFGIVARYLESGPTQSIKPTIRNLFGRPLRASYTSGGLDFVARETEACWCLSPTQIAEKMTAFPYCAAMSSPERAQLILDRMCGILPAGAKHVRMMASWTIGCHGHRYCHACLREDKMTDGVTHWRRSHQLPGVVICPLHGEVLWELGNHANNGNLGYVSPSAAIRLGAARIDLNMTSRQKKCCQRVAQVSADLLNGSLAVDTSSFAEYFRDFMRGASRYLRGSKHGDCMNRLMSQCFGDEYLKMHGVIRKGLAFFNTLSERSRQHPMRNVIALSLMRLVEEQPVLLADWRFKDIYDYSLPQEARKALPEVVCPSQFARHGPSYIVPKVRRRRGRLYAVCDCGMRFMCAETAEGATLMRVTRWTPDYDNEVRRLARRGMTAAAIARRIGVPYNTVRSMMSINGRFHTRVLPITSGSSAKRRSDR
ncbi:MULTISPECIES: TniQ family protein [unclassified Burkholderia]|uniref:TniQ family protein n=1 Tax=unclassified Burkholderia TaxID=2613784 RepID=UPI002AB17BF5|nr:MULTISPECIES: TniQ family protein [unclassified Burkholderia]